jgi:hypothetical protein
MQGSYGEAYSHLAACLAIKQEVFRYKPQSQELITVHRIIQGLLALLEEQLTDLRDHKKPQIDQMVKLKQTI